MKLETILFLAIAFAAFCAMVIVVANHVAQKWFIVDTEEQGPDA